jgi:hypothetical protein
LSEEVAAGWAVVESDVEEVVEVAATALCVDSGAVGVRLLLESKEADVLSSEDAAAGWTIVESEVMEAVDVVVAAVCVGAGSDEEATVGSVLENAMCAGIGTVEVESVYV